ncbi:YciI family protein, partial [Streptomyces mutabilis]|uniref:YciI family protein n=1 Tax=Streptomyces mutabilis TaxID=67332 RepID=UPI0036BB73E0
MFVLELSYTAPLEAVDALLADHVAWLDELYERGVFLASGRKEPRDGGVLIARAGGPARVEAYNAGRPRGRGGGGAHPR